MTYEEIALEIAELEKQSIRISRRIDFLEKQFDALKKIEKQPKGLRDESL